MSPQQNTSRPGLSHRRGSVSAPDPFAQHAHLNTARSSSTLSIVRLPNPQAALPQHPTPTLADPPSPGPAAAVRHGRHHRRHGSGASADLPADLNTSPRLSFALSSFAGGQGTGAAGPAGRPPSPARSPVLRASSPTAPRRTASPSHSRGYRPGPQPRLSPEQLYELARQAQHPPHAVPAAQAAPLSSTSTASGHAHGGSPVASPRISYQQPQQAVSPAHERVNFLPMADDVYLPFIDRPAEVKLLISTPPSAKLFSLLAQIFPREAAPTDEPPAKGADHVTEADREPPPSPTLYFRPSSFSHSASASLSSNAPPRSPSPPPPPLDAFPIDPTQWAPAHLHAWLTAVPRSTAPDAVWVARARRCVRARSELVWERVKGALGVPWELDVDDEPAEPGPLEAALREFDAGTPGEGRAGALGAEERAQDEEGAVMDSDADSTRASVLAEPGSSAPSVSALDGPPASSTPIDIPAPPSPASSALLDSEEYADAVEDYDENDDADAFAVHISAIVASPLGPAPSGPSAAAGNPPPLSLPASVSAPAAGEGALGDIGEEEEEEEAAEAGGTPTHLGPDDGEKEQQEPAPEVHGLRISTAPAPAPSAAWAAPSPAASPYAPQPGAHGRALSTPAGARPAPTPPQRAYSFSAASLPSPALRALGGGAYFAAGGGYDPVGDRAPGNPLFPSSFARLAVGPTLSANNPSLRAPPHPPLPRYGANPHAIRTGGRGPASVGAGSASGPARPPARRRPSWAEGWDAARQEYALTVASGESVGVGGE